MLLVKGMVAATWDHAAPCSCSAHHAFMLPALTCICGRAFRCSQAFLLAAMKFHCYVRALPAAPAPGTAVLLDAILSGGC